MTNCIHENLIPSVSDQTLGVRCLDCDKLVAWCWGDKHCPETLWNRACLNDTNMVPNEQDRDDVCFLCGEKFNV